MKRNLTALLTLTLVGTLLLAGCRNTAPQTETTTTSNSTSDTPDTPDTPVYDLLSPSANLEEGLQTLIDENGSFEDLITLVGSAPHVEREKYAAASSYYGAYADVKRLYKIWYCEGDRLLAVKLEELDVTPTSSEFCVTGYEYWTSPFRAISKQLENSMPAELAVSIEFAGEKVANTISDEEAINSIADRLNDYALYQILNPSEYNYWRDLMDHNTITAVPYQLDVLNGSGESVGTVEILLILDEDAPVYYEGNYAAIRYNDGSATGEWIITDCTMTKALVEQLFSGSLPFANTLSEPDLGSDVVWDTTEYNTVLNREGWRPAANQLYAEFLGVKIDPAKAKESTYKDYYQLSDAEDEFTEFAVYFLYDDYDWDYRRENGHFRECDWDALVDYLADFGIEEIGRERGFTVPIFAASITELEQLDCATLMDVMGVTDYTPEDNRVGLLVMLSGVTEAYNQSIIRDCAAYRDLPAWTEAEE